MSEHAHGFGCPETPEHAQTPIYDESAWQAGLAPLPTVDQVRAEYESQRAAGFAQGGAA